MKPPRRAKGAIALKTNLVALVAIPHPRRPLNTLRAAVGGADELNIEAIMQRKQTRRAFVQNGTLLLAASGATALLPNTSAAEASNTVTLRAGLITDLHYADKPVAGSRHYRETRDKLNEAIAKFNEVKTDMVVELGDLIDAAPSVEKELEYLDTINKILGKFSGEKHYVLGNHCVETLTKYEFLLSVGQKKPYYSFDKAGWHFVVLDACFNSDNTPYERGNSKWDNSNISVDELKWLRADLKDIKTPTIVFVHQRLDGNGPHTIRNAAEVRQILESSSTVAVFQGHSHANDHTEIAGVHYVTQVAMVEGTGQQNNGYSILEFMADGSLKVIGFRKQATRKIK